MKKDTYYFSHDSNAKDDPKCMALIDDLGMEGYGIFWVLIETLRNQPDYKCPISILKSIARQYNTTLPKVEVVVKNYGLFTIQDELFFFSESLNRRMYVADAKRLKLSEAGRNGNMKRWENSMLPSPPDSHPIATQSQLKEIKENKIKLNKNNIPSESEFLAYAKTEIPTKYDLLEFSLKAKYDAWVDNGWKDGNNKPIKNWKSKLKNTIPHLKEFKPTAGTSVKSNAKEII